MMRGVLIILLVLAAAYGSALFWPGPQPVSHPWLDAQHETRAERIAHGGGLGRAPANTIAALEQAVADGADVLEVDLQMTADGYLVLLHDGSVDRTTNGTGRIDALRLNDVTALDAAFGYEGEPADRFAGQGITIPFVYDAFAAFPDMRWIVEIKPQTEDAAMATCMAITETDMGHPGFANRVLVGSFHDDVLRRFREVCPRIATGMGRREAFSFYVMARLGLAKFHPTRAVAAQLPPRASGLDVIHPRLVDAAHARGLAVQVWTINDPGEMAALIARGVDGIITDRIDVMADVQGE